MPTFNSTVYLTVISQCKLSRREALIFYKLLGFLIRNDKPFPYSSPSLSKNTLYSSRSIEYSLKKLDEKKIIERIGKSYNRRFKKGELLIDICTQAQKCIDLELVKKLTQPQPLRRPPQSLRRIKQGKLKDLKNSSFSVQEKYNADYHEYRGRIESDRKMGLSSGNQEILELNDWLKLNNEALT